MDNPENDTNTTITLALAQIAPVWMNRDATLSKVVEWIRKAAEKNCDLVAFGEALVPGYPFWLSVTDGACFESDLQKSWYAAYVRESVVIERGDLNPVCEAAKETETAVVLGIVERPLERGGHSLFCSAVLVDKTGTIINVHRKLQPTYEERLVWSQGDGNGLCTNSLGPFSIGILNCWENWMPLARTALYADGENVHLALWPGSLRNTAEITLHAAREGRSYVGAVSGLLRRSDIGDHVPGHAALRELLPEYPANGGTGIAGPDGRWIKPPLTESEGLVTARLNIEEVWRERQNFDPVGHYARPDVLELSVNRGRPKGIRLTSNTV